MMRTARVVLVLVMMTVVGATPAFAAQGGTDRPFRMTATTLGTVDDTTGEFENDGTVTGTHFGTGTIHSEGNVLDVAYVTTITAANGDLLISRFVEFASFDPANLVCPTGFQRFVVIQSFTGGTGRFTDATGSFYVEGCTGGVSTAVEGFVLAVGTISY